MRETPVRRKVVEQDETHLRREKALEWVLKKPRRSLHNDEKNKYLYISSSSSSYRAGSTDIPDPLSPLLPIVHRPR